MNLNDSLANNYISDIETIILNINSNHFNDHDIIDIDNMINYSMFILSIEGLHNKSLKNVKGTSNLIFDYNVISHLNSIIYIFKNYKSVKPKKLIERFDREVENYLNFSNKLMDSYNTLLGVFDVLITVLPKVIKNIKIYEDILSCKVKFNKLNKRILHIIRYHIPKLEKTLIDFKNCRLVIYDILDIFDNSQQVLSNMYIKEDYKFDE